MWSSESHEGLNLLTQQSIFQMFLAPPCTLPMLWLGLTFGIFPPLFWLLKCLLLKVLRLSALSQAICCCCPFHWEKRAVQTTPIPLRWTVDFSALLCEVSGFALHLKLQIYFDSCCPSFPCSPGTAVDCVCLSTSTFLELSFLIK